MTQRLLEIADRVRDAFSPDAGVAALWLGGSLGRGEGDVLSDVDLVLVAAPGKVAELVGSVRSKLGVAGDVALVHEAPQNAPVDGLQLNVLYRTEPLPTYVDWNVWPHVNGRPSDVRPLFEREPMMASEHSFHSLLETMPRGSNTPLAERLSAFRLFMVPILMKHAARGWFESVAQIARYMLIEDHPESFEGAKALAMSLLEKIDADPNAVRAILRYVNQVAPCT